MQVRYRGLEYIQRNPTYLLTARLVSARRAHAGSIDSRWAGYRGAGRGTLALESVMHLFAMDGDCRGSFNPQPHLVAANIDKGEDDILPNDNGFIPLP